jgi:peptide/bleomycin uptake transporter
VFRSFFPRPIIFFLSAIVWALLATAIWYLAGDVMGTALGFSMPLPDAEPIIGIGYFVTPEFLWFYCYYIVIAGLFALFWFYFAPHPWQLWSIAGSALILFSTYFSVQVSVAINEWRRPFFDSVQDALSGSGAVSSEQLVSLILDFANIAFVAILVTVVTSFFVSHYVFRWRTAMNK